MLPRLLAPDLPSSNSVTVVRCPQCIVEAKGYNSAISLRYLRMSRLGNLRACCRSLDVVAVSQAASPEPNPDSPLPVNATVGPYPTVES